MNYVRLGSGETRWDCESGEETLGCCDRTGSRRNLEVYLNIKSNAIKKPSQTLTPAARLNMASLRIPACVF